MAQRGTVVANSVGEGARVGRVKFGSKLAQGDKTGSAGSTTEESPDAMHQGSGSVLRRHAGGRRGAHR